MPCVGAGFDFGLTLCLQSARISDHEEKVYGPSTLLEFLGFVIDTISRLPEEKLHHLTSLPCAWVSRKSCSKRELLSLIGSLQQASAVVKPGSQKND
jgi:hypothetical protein